MTLEVFGEGRFAANQKPCRSLQGSQETIADTVQRAPINRVAIGRALVERGRDSGGSELLRRLFENS